MIREQQDPQMPLPLRKKFSKIPCVFLLMFFLILNGSFLLESGSPKYIKIADRITSNTLKKLKTKDLKLVGSGGSMMNNIGEVSLHFYYYHPTTIDEARNLLLEITEDLISSFNSNEEIRPYLANYPFNQNNLEISISFTQKSNVYQDPPSLSLASAEDSILSYDRHDPEKSKLITIFQETYEEAQQKAQLRTDESHLSQTI